MIIYLHSLKKEYFTKLIFGGIKLKLPIEKGEKIGVVGKNGEGKTTLLKLIAGIEHNDGGSIKIEPKRTRIFYISVDKVNENNLTCEEFLLSINPYLYTQKKEMESLGEHLNDEKNLELFGQLQEKYEKSGGYQWEERVEDMLKNLKLKNKNIETLSGGEKSKLILASIQIVDADLVLMDEPTNHLDLKTLLELEKFLETDKKSYIIVSHDQKFLDNVATKILSIEKTKVKLYEGNYSSYKIQKENEEEELYEKYIETEREVKRLHKLASDIVEKNLSGMSKVVASGSIHSGKKTFINTLGVKQKVATDKDKMSTHYHNQRLQARMHDARVVRDKMNRIERIEKPKKDWGIKVDLKESDVSSDFILKTKNVHCKLFSEVYGEREFSFPDITITKGEKTALIGPNGTGKSTLAKIIMGINNDYTGEVKIPDSITIGYYSQTHELIDPNKNVLLNLLDIDKITDYDTPAVKEARNYLHQMLFTGDMALQMAKDLSQGEKSKLVLAKIIYKNPNFLLLDEPTNHLDIPSKERLEEALKNYKGAMLVISHDRYFMESIGIEKYIELEEEKTLLK